MADKYIPDDLRDVSTPDTDKDYFKLVVTDLNVLTTYPFQFRWQYEDKTYSEWSATYSVTTKGEATLNRPKFTSAELSYTTNTLLVSWSGKDYLDQDYGKNLARIDIYARGGSFGANYKVVGQFLKAGTQTITAVAGQYWVKLQAVSTIGEVSDFSAEQTIITESPIVVDTDPPANPTGFTASVGVDPKDQTGFSAFATFSWTHNANAATNGTRGYRLRWTYDTINPIYEYAFVNYPINSYTATGLIPNVEYTYQIASVDQFNNTQTYDTGGTFTAVDATNPDGWARLKSYLSIGGATGDLFKFGTGITTSINTSLTTTPSLTSGTYNGIILNKTGNNNNYWLTTGQLRVGGNTQFMYWDGTNLSISGDLGVGGGATIAGNLFMKTSGASIYSGSLTAGALADGTAGYILNNSGLLIQNNETGSNRKYVRLDPATGTLFANNAQITGELIITSGATKTLIDNAAAAAAAKNKTFIQAAEPTNPISGYSLVAGDLWFDSDDGNKQYRWNGSSWALVQDTSIAAAKAKADSSLQTGGNAIINPTTNQITTIGITGIKIASGGVNLNGTGTATTASAGSLVLNSSGITAQDGSSNTTFFINATTGDAEFKGSIKSGSTITGATVTAASDNSSGNLRLNSTNRTLEFLSTTGSVVGRALVYGDSEAIFAAGSNAAYGSYPASAGFVSVSPGAGVAQASLRITNSVGTAIGSITINATDAYFSGVNVQTYQGAPIGTSNYYMRNIGMGTGAKLTTDTDGLRGDIWIQYS